MNIFQRAICWMYFKFAYKESDIAHHLVAYYVPGVIRKVRPQSDGSFFLGEVNRINGDLEPIVELSWGDHLKDKTEEGDVVTVNITDQDKPA